MRPNFTNSVILAVGLLGAACSADAPVGPTSAEVPAARLVAQATFRGSFTSELAGVVAPPHLLLSGVLRGTATHLGRFSGTSSDLVLLGAGSSTGTLNLTAANGDQLFVTTIGGEDELIGPGVSRISFVATIIGGTGRFAAATGAFTIRQILRFDVQTGLSTASGSFDGHIDMK